MDHKTESFSLTNGYSPNCCATPSSMCTSVISGVLITTTLAWSESGIR